MSLRCSPVTTSNLPQSAALDPHRPLYIERVKPEDYPKIERIAKDWVSIAQKKLEDTNISKEIDAHSMLNDSWYTTSGILSVIKQNSEQPEKHKILVCKDTKGEIHGILTVQTKLIPDKRRCLFIPALLVTHPRNIRCKANLSETQRVEGVGRALFNFADKEISKNGLDSVSFTPSDSGVPFYEKLGLTLEKKNNKMKKSFLPSVSSKL